MSLSNDEVKYEVIDLKFNKGLSDREIADSTGIARSTLGDFFRKESHKEWWLDYDEKVDSGVIKPKGPRMLVIDIESSPVLGAVWGMYNQNLSLDMIHKDWYLLSYAAKFIGEDTIYYNDKSDSWGDEDDTHLVIEIWELLDQADIVIGQNSRRFDTKKINSRFILNGMKPPSKYRQVDTLEIAKKSFGFTSNKLEYMTDKICTQYKKLKHGKFAGYLLWRECLKGNPEAWLEMATYNKHDVLSTEELYIKMRPWMNNHPNMNVYSDSLDTKCVCGSDNWEHSGYAYTNLSKFDKFTCQDCGAEVRGRVNLLPKEKRETLKGNIV